MLGEYRYGISQSRQRTYYEGWLSEYLPKFRVLEIDQGTTLPYSAVRTELKKQGQAHFPQMTYRSQPYALSTGCLSSAATVTSTS